MPEVLSVVRRLNFGKARIVPTSFVEPSFRGIESDIIWKIPFRSKRNCFVYVLIEHQSARRYFMALRVLRYMAALYGSIEKSAGKKKRSSSRLALPAVVPIVLYCGVEPWDVPLRFEDLLSYHLPVPDPFLAARYALIDVNCLSKETLLRRRNALSGLFFLEKGRLSATEEYFESAIACLSAEKDWSFLEAVVMMAYTILRDRGEVRSPKKIAAWFRAKRTKEQDMAQTMREYLEKIGRKRGREEGFEKGIEKGVEKGLARALASLRKAFRRRGVAPETYESDFGKLTDPGKVVDLAASFMAAKDPHAYLRRRFGH
jgi:hypothetical protein